ncbi:hypothetical protein BDW62DRAFT_199583 [Aspergillus aurantiobrunneus]
MVVMDGVARNIAQQPYKEAVYHAEIYKHYDCIWDSVFTSLCRQPRKNSARPTSKPGRRRVGSGSSTSTFGDLGTSLEANETAAAFIRDKIASIVKDPETARLLQSRGPYGGRPLCTQGYYEAFNDPKVSLVDIRTSRIEKITTTGLELQDGRSFDLDVIVGATGFDGVDGAYRGIDITGRSGTLNEAWEAGPSTRRLCTASS